MVVLYCFRSLDTLKMDNIKKLIKAVLRTYVKYLPIYLNGYWFYMSTRNIELVPFMILGKFQKGTVTTLEKIVKKDWTVCEIGAYIGDNTAILSNLVGMNGRVISIEPEPDHFRLLQKNIRLNRLKNVETHQIAISNKNGWGTIYTPEINSPDSRLFKLSGESRTGHQVKIKKLDSLLEKEKRIDLVIIDVQGWEEKVLSGAKKTLTTNKNIVLITEFWPEGLLKAKTNIKKFLQ